MRLFSLIINKSLLPARGSFASHVLSLMTSSMMAQGLGIITAPIITRLYSPADFGIMAAFLSLTNIIAVVASWRYEIAIMLPKQEDEAKDVMLLASIITIGMSILSLFVMVFFRHKVASLLKTPELAFWLWFAPLNVFLIGFANILNYWTTRHKGFGLLAMSRLGSAAAGASVQIGGGFLTSGGPAGLIMGQLVGWGTAAGVRFHRRGSQGGFKLGRTLSLKNLIARGKEYYLFPLLDSWGTLANFGAHKIPILIITYFFGTAVAGYYFLGYRVLNLPLAFVSSSIAQVFFQRYEEYKYSDNKAIFLWKMIKSLGLVSILPSILMLVFAPIIFKICFGDEWTIAGEYIRVLTPVLFLRFIISPLSSVLWSEKKNSWSLMWQFFLLVSAIISLCIGGYYNNIFLGLLLLSISHSIMYLILIMIIIKVSSKNILS